MLFQIHSVNELNHLPSLNALRFKGNPLFKGKIWISNTSVFIVLTSSTRIQYDSLDLVFQMKLHSKVVKNCLLAFLRSRLSMEARWVDRRVHLWCKIFTVVKQLKFSICNYSQSFMASLAAKFFERCSDFILACSIEGFPQWKLHSCMNVLILWKFVKLGIDRFFVFQRILQSCCVWSKELGNISH